MHDKLNLEFAFHEFSQQLEVLIPECPVQSAIQCAQSPQLDRSCYYLAEIPVVVFTRMDFIEAFIKQGSVCCSMIDWIYIQLAYKGSDVESAYIHKIIFQ